MTDMDGSAPWAIAGTCEIYDPASNTWAPAPSLTTPRRNHQAILLADGRVLVTGGDALGATAPFSSAELYDPVTNVWTAAPPMAVARAHHASALLPDGRVVVAGGFTGLRSDGAWDAATTAEFFDPATGLWSGAGSTQERRIAAPATLLLDGRVLLAGGFHADAPNGLSSSEILDPFDDRWRPAGDMSAARIQHTASRLSDERVLVAGGTALVGGSPSALASVDIYSPRTNSWSAGAFMAEARSNHAAVTLQDGRVLVTGGGLGSASDTAETYDPAADRWSPAARMVKGRAGHTATLLQSGRVLVVGGQDEKAEVYDALTNQWSTAGLLDGRRVDHTATLLQDGRVLVAGGLDLNRGAALNSALLYDPATGRWAGAASMDLPRAVHTATCLPDGRVLVAGGRKDGVEALSSTELYDPTANRWSPGPSMGVARGKHTATLLPDGRILVAGGRSRPPSAGTSLSSAEIYDPASGRWIPTGAMATARAFHTGTDLGNGSVLLVGGLISPEVYSSKAEVFHYNRRPRADAGPDLAFECTGAPGVLVTLDGTGSVDPDADLLTYTWSGTFGRADGAVVTLTLPLGVHLITLTVDDGWGRGASDTVVVTVQDTQRPQLLGVVDSLQVEQTSWAGTPVNLTPPAAVDACDGAPVVTGDVPSVFPLGTTEVTWTATDASGNVFVATTVVTVVDTTPPAIGTGGTYNAARNFQDGVQNDAWGGWAYGWKESPGIGRLNRYSAFAVDGASGAHRKVWWDYEYGPNGLNSPYRGANVVHNAGLPSTLGDLGITWKLGQASFTPGLGRVSVYRWTVPPPTGVEHEYEITATFSDITGGRTQSRVFVKFIHDTQSVQPLSEGIYLHQGWILGPSGKLESTYTGTLKFTPMPVNGALPAIDFIVESQSRSPELDATGIDATIRSISARPLMVAADQLPVPVAIDLCDAAPAVTITGAASLTPGTHPVTYTATDRSGNATRATVDVYVSDESVPIAFGGTYHAGLDFQGGVQEWSNPWGYGWKTGPEFGLLNPFRAFAIDRSRWIWWDYDYGANGLRSPYQGPNVVRNVASRVTLGDLGITWESGQTSLTPGLGKVSVYRWTVPAAPGPREYEISATFSDMTGGQTRSRVFVKVISDVDANRPVGEGFFLHQGLIDAPSGKLKSTYTGKVALSPMFMGKFAAVDFMVQSQSSEPYLDTTGIEAKIVLPNPVEQISRDGAPAPPLPPSLVAFDPQGRSLTISPSTGTALLPLGRNEIVYFVHGPGSGTSSRVTLDVVDTIPPILTTPGPLTVEATGPAGAAAPLPAPQVSDICDAAPIVSSDAPSVFPLGTTLVTFTAVDASGNAASATTPVTVVDRTPPTFSDVPAPIIVEQSSRDGTPVAVSLPLAADSVDPNPAVRSDAPAVFPLGTTVVTFTAIDAAGNLATATTEVTVVDTSPPVFVRIPEAVTIEQTGFSGTPFAVPMPTVSDICDAAPKVASDAPAVFPLGTTVVTYTALDAAGNGSSATTTVTVHDTTPPVFSAVPGPVVVEQTDRNGTPVSVARPAASDACDAAPKILSDAPPVFPLGSTVVTFTAVDASGNKAAATTTVTVRDTTAPVISSVTASPGELSPPDHLLKPVTLSVSATDICDSAPKCKITSVTSNQPVTQPGDVTTPDWEITGDLTLNLRAEFSRGMDRRYTVTVSCVDASGNTATAHVIVTVPRTAGP
jgi:N-acetylneuraminic acid mutarotase